MKIAIIGRAPDTTNYVRYVQSAGFLPLVTLDASTASCCQGIILPGGGDVTPAFFGEENRGSRNIDTELDILQLQALDMAIRNNLPVLGICKGMQVINIGLGGTVIQDLPTGEYHRYNNGDQYHSSVIRGNTWLYSLYGREITVNSAHHQALGKLGHGLSAIQHCPLDDCVEAISHEALPVIGVQWHPERIDWKRSSINGTKILAYFSSLILSSGQAFQE